MKKEVKWGDGNIKNSGKKTSQRKEQGIGMKHFLYV